MKEKMMGKKAQVLILLILTVTLAMVLPTEAEAAMVTVEELTNYLGYSKADTEKLFGGEIISRGLESGSEKELAITVSMLVRVSLPKILEFARSGEVFKVNREIIKFIELGDATPNKNDFTGLAYDAEEADEVDKLLEVEPDDTFNLSKSEIERFKAISNKFKSKEAKNQAVREAVNAEYQAILMDRYKSYREGGLGAIAPYDRGSKQSNASKELSDETKRGKLMREKMPEFYRALLNYPRDSADDIQNQFFWLKTRVNKRPAFILAHRMYQFKPEQYVLAAFREFYVGHSYNSLHVVVAALPVKGGTVVVYLNRTSTDQVAGFGSGMKRQIGGKMLRNEVIKLFSNYRQSLEKGG